MKTALANRRDSNVDYAGTAPLKEKMISLLVCKQAPVVGRVLAGAGIPLSDFIDMKI